MADEDLGQRIGDYVLIEKLGCGGFGCVYKARHCQLPNRIVAIKVFLGNVDIKRERERFLSEARILDQLRHPSILSIIHVGVQQNTLGPDSAYLVTEFASNGSLRDRMDRTSLPMPLDEALALLANIGDGLSHAHAQNVIHRDLKPENILFNAKGEILLADFGIAVVLASGSRAGDRFGTPAYMAPEQFQEIASRRSDQYALACIAYELLTGQHPFEGFEGPALVFQQVNTIPKRPRLINPSLPLTVENALMRALEKNREDRYTDISSFLAALRSIPPPGVSRIPLRSQRSSFAAQWQHGQPADSLIRRNRGSDAWAREALLPDDFLVVPRRRRGLQPPVRTQEPLINSPLEDPYAHIQRSARSPRPRVRSVPLSPRSVPPRLVPPRPLPLRKQRDWSLILYGGLGWVCVGIGSIAFIVSPHMATPWFILCLFTFVIGILSFIACAIQALVSSYQAREWEWFVWLLAGLLGLIILGLLFGGFIPGIVSGIVVCVLVSMAYGWHHTAGEVWSIFRRTDQ